MDRWSGVLKVLLDPNNRNYYRIAASLCFSSTSKSLIDFIPSVNRYGEPKSYAPIGFPASTSTVSLLSSCHEQAKNVISSGQRKPCSTSVSGSQPKTLILGFSKGCTVLNQLVTELGSSEVKSPVNPKHVRQQPGVKELSGDQEQVQIIPRTKESLLNSITEIHYVDVGLNSSGAYITDQNVIGRISKRLVDRAPGIRFLLHGTPRQWCDSKRAWIRDEKDKLYRLPESEAPRSDGKLKVCARFYFADRLPDIQMHFEIIEKMDAG
ncbi:hypothetical protein CRYUN_Cryun20dG0012000 [Craigia yunnanensis]